MLDFHGDSGPYLQYTHARLCALLKKAETMGLEPELSDEAEMNKNELALIRHLADFSDAIVSAASEYAPNRVCLYLYELSNKTNTWYEGEHILSDENKARRAMRLALAETTALVLRKGLYLLGIPAPERI
jgi:arginyl-tRNA synthetase